MNDASDPARQLRDAIRGMMLAHGAFDEHRPCGTPLPTPHAWALLELHQHGPMTVTQLTAGLGIDRTNVSRLCTRMVSLGQLERISHAADRRARMVQLTAAGHRVAARVDRASADHFARVIEHLPNVTSAIEVLSALKDAMHTHAHRADAALE